MSVLVNLLPDTRQVKQRATKRRQLVGGIAITIFIVCGVVLALLGLAIASEKIAIAKLSGDITTKKDQLDKVAGLTDALTAQQHLASLPNLYNRRVYVSRFFEAYSKAAPTDTTLSSLNVEADDSLTVTGTATTYAAVAKLAKSLEAQKDSLGEPAFTSVTVKGVGGTGSAINYSLSATLEKGVTSGTN